MLTLPGFTKRIPPKLRSAAMCVWPLNTSVAAGSGKSAAISGIDVWCDPPSVVGYEGCVDCDSVGPVREGKAHSPLKQAEHGKRAAGLQDALGSSE